MNEDDEHRINTKPASLEREREREIGFSCCALLPHLSMADLNPNPSPSTLPSADGFSLESDDISTLLQTLLHSSQHHQPPALAAEDFRRQFFGSGAFSDSSPALDFSFRTDCYEIDGSERSRSAFSGAIASSGEEIGEFDCETEKDQDGSDVRNSESRSRNSSKRTRASEFHNISEKRRRQRINEKMKALQKLIPNSNKTDKASMLDEAIEYLKQLQLQVQMLALRNGSTLQPFYIPGVMQSAQPSATGIYYNGSEGLPSSSRGAGSLTAEQELPLQAVYNASTRRASSEQKMLGPSILNHDSSGFSFALEPSPNAHCRPFNLMMPSKDLYGGSKLSQMQLDTGCYGDESSSGVSS